MSEPSSGDPNVYVFTGHGYEYVKPFEERKKLPEGVTLVTFTECGMPTQIPDIIRVFEKMKQKEPFVNPVRDKKKIETLLGKGLRVYAPGDPYPPLYYMPVGEHNPPERKGEPYTIYFKSGVHKLPITLSPQPGWKFKPTVVRHQPTRYTFAPEEWTFLQYGRLAKGVTPDEEATDPSLASLAKLSLEGAVFPDEATFQAILDKTKPNGFPIEEVFTKLGPGVYYWPICRGDIHTEAPEAQKIIEDTRSKSTLRQRVGGKRRRSRIRKTIRRRKVH